MRLSNTGLLKVQIKVQIFRHGILIVLLLLLSGASTPGFAQSLLDDAAAISLTDNWQMRWGDSPIDADGHFVWLDDKWDDPAWKSTDVPHYRFKQRVETKKAWYRIKLPPEPIPHGLYVRELNQVFEVYQAGELIYRFGELVLDDDVQFLGYSRHLIRIESGAGNEILHFRVQSNVREVGFAGNPPELVNPEFKLRTLAASEADSFFLGSIYLFVGLFSLIFFLRNRNDKIYLGYGALTLGMGSWTCVNTITLGLVIDANQVLFYVDKIGLYSAIAGFFYFTEQILNPRFKVYVRLLWISHLSSFYRAFPRPVPSCRVVAF